MIGNSLTKQSRIKPENINYHQFTLSLMNEGMQAGLLSVTQIERIQAELMSMLSEYILKYTHNESNSVKVEIAQDIMESLLYCVDMYLKNFSCIEQSIEMLQKINIHELHEQGLQLANSNIEQAEQLLQEVKNTMLSVPLIAYNETIHNCFGEFFHNYNIKFNAHNTVTSIDYPLLLDDMSWTGIIYIKKYLEHLKLENEFCAFFPLSDINKLLECYGQQYKLNCTDLLINISELVLKNAICSVLIGKKADCLVIDQENCDLLEQRLRKLTEEQLKELLRGTINMIFRQFDITNPALQLYIQTFTNKFYPQLINAIKDNSLSGLITIIKETSAHNTLYYEAGKKLSDEQLRVVIDELAECQNGEAKASLIESEIHNMEDLIEIFDAYYIFDSEYETIFSRMGDYELAILASNLLDHSPLSNTKDLSVDRWNCSENKLYWQHKLIQFIEASDMNRYKNIIQLAKEIKVKR